MSYPKKKKLKESKEIVESPLELANIVEFFVVEKSKDPMDDPMKLVWKTDPVSFANQIRGGLLPEDIHGFYLTEDEALSVAHDTVQSVYEAARGLEEKKSKVTTKLGSKIKSLQKEVDAHLRAAKEDPINADSHQTQAEAVLARIRELRKKSDLVEKSKKPLEEKEKEEKPEKKKLSEGFKANRGISNATKLFKQNPDSWRGDPAVLQELIDAKVGGSFIFQIAALFPRDSFKPSFLKDGRVEQAIDKFVLNPQPEFLRQVKALKAFTQEMDKIYYPGWESKF